MIDPRLEDLADDCMERIAREGETAIPAFCTEHGVAEPELRRVLQNLARVGLLHAPPGVEPPRELGDFVLLRRLGEGGMAVVYEAEQRSLGRRVALKLLRLGAFQGTHARERFRREVAALGRLDHPGICAVHGAGEVDGVPYLAMRLIDGETLAVRIARARAATTPMPVADTLALVEKVARAVHAAHEAGVIHRDLKPGNIMLDARGEPVVLDFGLARASDGSDGTFTSTGDQPGTPAYMAPEQIDARWGPIDRRTDVYGVGATLYECLTLRTPFGADSRVSTFHGILNSALAPPRRFNRAVGKDLGVVLLRALEREPGHRFATAAEFADELRAIRCHEPIRSRPPSLPLRGWRWAQRNRAAAVALIAVSLALALSLLLLASNARERQRYQALATGTTASEVLRENPLLAFKLARAALRLEPTSLAHAMRLQQAMGELHELHRLDDFGGLRLRRAIWSPDSQLLLVGPDGLGPPCLYGRDGELLARLGSHGALAEAIAFAPDGEEIAVGGDGEVAFFARRGAHLRTIRFGTAWIWSLRYAPDGRHLAVGAEDGQAAVWRRDGTLRAPLVGHSGPVRTLAWLSDAQVVTAGGSGNTLVEATRADNTVRLWSLDADSRTLTEHQRSVWSVTCAEDRIATASFDGSLRIFDGGGIEIATHTFPSEMLFGAEFSRDGQLIVSCSDKGRVRLHDRDGKLVREWTPQPRASLTAVRFLPDGSRLATASWNQRLQVWNLEGDEQLSWRGHLNGLTDVACSPDGERIASTSWDGTARIWGEEPRGTRAVSGVLGGVARLVVEPGGGRVFIVGRGGEVVLANGDGEVLWRRRPHVGDPVGAAFRADGRRLLVAYPDGVLFVLGDADGAGVRTETGLTLVGATFQPEDDGVVLITPDAVRELTLGGAGAAVPSWRLPTGTVPLMRRTLVDGRHLLTRTEEGVVELLDLASGRRRVALPMPQGTVVISGALSRDGRWLVLVAENGAAELWDVEKRTRAQRYHGHLGGVEHVALSPDPAHRYVLTGSNDDTLRCFDRESGAQLAAMRGHHAGVRQVAFSNDGRRAISGSADGVVRWWWLDGGAALQAAEALGIGDPTEAERLLAPLLFR